MSTTKGSPPFKKCVSCLGCFTRKIAKEIVEISEHCSSLLEVTAVEAASPADKGGLRVGDTILQVAGKTPRNFIEFMRELNATGVDKPVSLLIRRAGAQQTLAVRLTPESDFFNADLVRQRTGLHVQKLTRELAANMGFPFFGGFVVADVDKDSPAAEAKFEKYFVVRGVDNQPTAELVELGRALHAKKAGDTAQFEAQADWLKTTKTFDAEVKSITVRGKAFAGVKFNFPKGNEAAPVHK